MAATIQGLAALAAGAAAGQPEPPPDAVMALHNALQGLGSAYVEFGKAVQAIDVRKAAGVDANGKKKRVRATRWLCCPADYLRHAPAVRCPRPLNLCV